jgi:acid phosphatase
MRRTSILLAALFLMGAQTGCLYRKPWKDDAFTIRSPAGLSALPDGPALRVLVIGDHGTGGEGQREVSRAIAQTHATDPPDFVLTVGDNFYPDGVESVDDPLWATVFEDVYSGDFWDAQVFFPVLGNHDVKGSVEAQIDYSDQSTKWSMPGDYYTLWKPLPAGDSVLVLALDTNTMVGGGNDDQTQLEWIDSVLSATGDEWVVAIGHHPFATGGWHKPSQRVGEKLMPHFQGQVSLYLSGHNHSTELLRTEEGVLQAVCGGGAGRDNAYRVKQTPQTVAAFSNGGWCLLHIWPDTMAIEGYNRAGTLLFRQLIPRRSSSRASTSPANPLSAGSVPGRADGIDRTDHIDRIREESE